MSKPPGNTLSMRQVFLIAALVGVIGYAVAIYVSNDTAMSPTIGYLLCPPAILGRATVADPDSQIIWDFYAPLNAFLYAVVAFSIGLWRTYSSDTR